MNVSEKIKDLRLKKNISTYELSKITGIPQSTISKIENGKRKIDIEILNKIATALDVPLNYFFDDKTYPKTNSFEKVDKIIEGNKIETLAAHFKSEKFTDEDIEDIESFIRFILSKKQK
ncbi:Transcriptional regulator, contains XRE-family HTH domain [Caloramator quimbayensis]|uniref:Transcriptional regulator, contains XRE-family HTH domain n=1 Tax=Caloramator quimbayensis TaxID=1147123 RepID=A0A1T4WYD4_9CLOT|nr:helix-turn-helix domain-containing protein [Caloramator quimbayensis]SKA82336.1 Transcriptional regulator, contains XRE-family HTH domain [Caloramator quimbayensis]